MSGCVYYGGTENTFTFRSKQCLNSKWNYHLSKVLQAPVSPKSNFAGFQLDFIVQITDISAGDDEEFTEQPDGIYATSAHIFSQR